jgi:hypothetical protein
MLVDDMAGKEPGRYCSSCMTCRKLKSFGPLLRNFNSTFVSQKTPCHAYGVIWRLLTQEPCFVGWGSDLGGFGWIPGPRKWNQLTQAVPAPRLVSGTPFSTPSLECCTVYYRPYK